LDALAGWQQEIATCCQAANVGDLNGPPTACISLKNGSMALADQFPFARANELQRALRTRRECYRLIVIHLLAQNGQRQC